MTTDEIVIEQLRIGAVSVDAEGRVWRHGRLEDGKLTPFPAPRRIDRKGTLGYYQVRLHHKKQKANTSAHRMQWMQHHGLIPDGLEVHHKDHDKANNRLDNLELVTHLRNLEHAAEAKGGWWVARGGEKHHNAKLDWEKVRWIRANVGKGPGKITQAAAAEKFGLTQPMISAVMSGKYWKEEPKGTT